MKLNENRKLMKYIAKISVLLNHGIGYHGKAVGMA